MTLLYISHTYRIFHMNRYNFVSKVVTNCQTQAPLFLCNMGVTIMVMLLHNLSSYSSLIQATNWEKQVSQTDQTLRKQAGGLFLRKIQLLLFIIHKHYKYKHMVQAMIKTLTRFKLLVLLFTAFYKNKWEDTTYKCTNNQSDVGCDLPIKWFTNNTP